MTVKLPINRGALGDSTREILQDVLNRIDSLTLPRVRDELTILTRNEASMSIQLLLEYGSGVIDIGYPFDGVSQHWPIKTELIARLLDRLIHRFFVTPILHTRDAGANPQRHLLLDRSARQIRLNLLRVKDF